jgi:hypothetical protein
VTSLSNLNVISLSNNELEGPFFQYLSSWPMLETIDIQSTSLSGSIPTEIGLLTKLVSLLAPLTRLQGTIPSELALLSNTLTYVSLGGPNLEGTLPASLGDLTLLGKCSFMG